MDWVNVVNVDGVSKCGGQDNIKCVDSLLDSIFFGKKSVFAKATIIEMKKKAIESWFLND